MNDEALLRRLRDDLDDAGLTGSLLVRDLDTGDEIGIDPDEQMPMASLVKLPLAIATLERIEAGELDGAASTTIEPGRITTPGPMGISRFRHRATVALDDLVYLSTSISDGAAADALFDLTPPAEVAACVERLGVTGMAVRQSTRGLVETPLEVLAPGDAGLAYDLAIGVAAQAGGHRMPQLDETRANVGSARSFVDLLAELWNPTLVPATVAARVRELLAAGVVRWRLAPDLASDSSTWSSKTGTLLNLRHEVGVVEHSDGRSFAIAALTRSRVAASTQPAAEATMGAVARALRDRLRS